MADKDRKAFHPAAASASTKGKSSTQNADRFIPNRSAMDFDYAHHKVTEKDKENPAESSPFEKQLAEALNIDIRNRPILAFKNKPSTRPPGAGPKPSDYYSATDHKQSKPRRHISKTPDRTLDAPGLLNDFYFNLLDWGSSNVVAIALGNTVHLWNATNGVTSQLVTVTNQNGPVTSVKWAPDGRRIAIGLNNSGVQLCDSTAPNLQPESLRGGHQSRVGCLDWKNNDILTTGGKDGKIINNDLRVSPHTAVTYTGHHQEVCGLKWSDSGQQLASGGNDNLLHIWDARATAASRSQTQWLHRLVAHTAAVKALAWCPFEQNLLASGGGRSDRCIKFWNTSTGDCLNSKDTGSQVCALLWNKKEKEILSAHGFAEDQLTLWKYPSMEKVTDLDGHTDIPRVLYMAQSPDGCTVASAAGDDLRFWNVFGTPGAAKPAPDPFARLEAVIR